jgi:hypothetical protein
MTLELTREQFFLSQTLKAAVPVADACFCATEQEEETINDPAYVESLRQELLDPEHGVTSNQLENAKALLRRLYVAPSISSI